MDPAQAPTLTVHQFQAKWRDVARQERAFAQEHFIDLCRLVGFKTPAEADPRGERYAFERRVPPVGGGRGFADVWYRGRFVWEYKRRGGDLDDAYDQLKRYREGLDNPPLLVVTDMDLTRVHTNFTGTPTRKHEFDLDDLDEPKGLDTLRNVFHAPEALRPGETVLSVTEAAAARFATLASALERRGVEPRRSAHFLVQLLFCLFAEDVGLLPKGLFTKLVLSSIERPDRFASRLDALFVAMRAGGDFGADAIAWFNGGLFAWTATEPLTKPELELLAEAADLDWGGVEPAIFGTLFERSLDPTKRKQLGLHYTPRRDIERVVLPVLIDPLRRRWEEVKAEAEELKLRWDASVLDAKQKRLSPDRKGGRAVSARQAFEAKLFGFQEELASVRVLDPATGSGNFLYVALAALLDLEKEVSRYGAANGLPLMLPRVGPTQLAGLEVNPYARELAQAVVWIGYLQWMRDNGFHPEREPVLKPLETIELRDALLSRPDGRATEAEWPEADVIVGNPPFLGGKLLRAGLGDAIVEELFAVYNGRVPREADLACYWHEKARAQIEAGRARRAGLLATNSIRGGANRRVLERIKRSGDIFMAWDDEEWIVDGAAVRTSIVGFDDGTERSRTLDGVPVRKINADLTATVDLTAAHPLRENRGIAFMGDTKGGPFDVPGDLAHAWLALPPNPNGRPNSDVVRPWVNGLDVTRRPRDMWIVDFGVGMPEEQAALYEAPFEYVREHVKPAREANRRASYRDRWWLHVEPRSGMRSALDGLPRFLVTPTVASHRLFVWESGATLPDHQLIVFARADDYFFGVLHSGAHEVWSLRMGTSLEDRPRYTPTTCFETFPFPQPSDAQRAAIGAAAKALDERRRAWLSAADNDRAEQKRRILTNLYNERPTWLRHAHAALDRAVWAAYGWEDPDPAAVEEDAILGRLLALNLERAGMDGGRPAASVEDRLVAEGVSGATIGRILDGAEIDRSPATLEPAPVGALDLDASEAVAK
ncbi:MAG: class I SAM-dependent DNA methyltransferase [Chloroflexota bacterium]|nr:class I SAM-dependent DNA methyltransferase [Chloroflexota bacterium]